MLMCPTLAFRNSMQGEVASKCVFECTSINSDAELIYF